ncbi:MAG: phosphodiester glycosidase family protein [bacterium]
MERMGICGLELHLAILQSTGREEVNLRLPDSANLPQKQTIALNPTKIEVVRKTVGRSRYVAIIGGRPGSRLINGRQPVSWFIRDAKAQAGINGAFFVMAAIRSKNSAMIGPVLAENGPGFVPCKPGVNSEKLEGRPYVIWNNQQITFVPYQPDMNEAEGTKAEVSDAVGAFVAGAWLVQNGRALTAKEIRLHGPRDTEQPRHRAMFGITNNGQVFIAASLDSVTSSMMAKAAAEYGCQAAALMDSGFSTSLVIGSKTLVSGHSTSKQPSRPVPHALVLYGDLSPSLSQ